MKTLPDFLFYLSLLALVALGIYSQFYFLAIIPAGILISVLSFKLYSLYWDTERIMREGKEKRRDSALTKKYRRAKIGRNIPFKAAMLITVASIFSAFSYVSFEDEDANVFPTVASPIDDTIIILPEVEIEKEILVLPKPIEKTPPPVILTTVKIFENDAPEPPKTKEIKPLEPDDKLIGDLIASKAVSKTVLPAPKPVAPSNALVPSFQLDRMPCLSECNIEEASNEEIRLCTHAALQNFFGKHTKYPSLAIENRKEGKVQVSFIVDVDGSVTDIEVTSDPGGGLGDEVKRVVSKLPQWVPGIQSERPVRVKYNTFFTFRLE